MPNEPVMTRDQFRQRFRDLAGAGIPIGQCLDLGSIWDGVNSSRSKSWLARDAFRQAFKDAIGSGIPLTQSLKVATDAVMSAPNPFRDELRSGTMPGTGKDKRVMFRGALRDALKAGRGFRDAIRDSVGDATGPCGCGCSHDAYKLGNRDA